MSLKYSKCLKVKAYRVKCAFELEKFLRILNLKSPPLNVPLMEISTRKILSFQTESRPLQVRLEEGEDLKNIQRH